MYLLDTNIWLERLLGQDNSEDVGRLLDQIHSDQLFITDFSFHSLCVILTRLKHSQVLIDFVEDVFANGAVELVIIDPEEIPLVVDVINKLNLDFDDAYQYVAAEQNNLVIVSFDSDFNKTPLGRKTPAEILAAT
jgi:predicted nucleic acid-binding protein